MNYHVGVCSDFYFCPNWILQNFVYLQINLYTKNSCMQLVLYYKYLFPSVKNMGITQAEQLVQED